jgi:hypothetical protein
VIIGKCDRCSAEVLNEHGAQIVWSAGRDFPPKTSQHWLVTLCANCRLDFEAFVGPGRSLTVRR